MSGVQLEEWVESALEQSGVPVLVTRRNLPIQKMKLPEGVTETHSAEALVRELK